MRAGSHDRLGKVGKHLAEQGVNYTSRFRAIMSCVRPIQDVHQPVRLLLKNGNHIGWLLVVSYDPWPEVMVSGTRVFRQSGMDSEGYRTYTEIGAHIDVFGIYSGEKPPAVLYRAGEFADGGSSNVSRIKSKGKDKFK